MKKLRVTVEGKVYEVLVEVLDEDAAPAPAAVESHASTPAPAPVSPVSSAAASTPPAHPVAKAGAGDVPSPLAGKIVSIDVKPGQQVVEGGQVATIEAMKMNTYIFAPMSGRVSEVLVHPGDGVEEGAVLLRIA